MTKELILSRSRFTLLALWTVRLTVLVVLWGAFTRLSGSGDGCGASWPLCKGVLVPQFSGLETAIEFVHRATSGAVIILAALVFFFARKVFPKGHLSRRSASIAFVLMITEAILGAVLVIFGWVDQNPSAARVISLSAHLVNTFLLISAQTSVVFFSSRDRVVSTAAWIRLRSYLIFGFVLLCISGIAGVVAALANMLHPSGSLAAGLQADFASDSPLLVRLRILHPIFSLIGVGYLVWLTKYATSGACASQLYGRGRLVRAVAVGQIGLGVITLAIGGLVPLKLLHLLVADLLVIAFAAFCADVLTADSSETALALDSAA